MGNVFFPKSLIDSYVEGVAKHFVTFHQSGYVDSASVIKMNVWFKSERIPNIGTVQ